MNKIRSNAAEDRSLILDSKFMYNKTTNKGDTSMKEKQIVASYQQFHVIAHDLDETDNLKSECKAQLGEGVRLADWNDIAAYGENGWFIGGFYQRTQDTP